MACNTCNSGSGCNNNNCTCNRTNNSCNSSNERRGTYKIIDSHMICNNSSRAVFFKDGGCSTVPKGYIPGGTKGDNGPKLTGVQQWGNNPMPESEGMDSLNYRFNRNRF